MSYQQQFNNPIQFYHTLNQPYDECYILDNLQSAVAIRYTYENKVVITQSSQTHSIIIRLNINMYWICQVLDIVSIINRMMQGEFLLDTYAYPWSTYINTRRKWSQILV